MCVFGVTNQKPVEKPLSSTSEDIARETEELHNIDDSLISHPVSNIIEFACTEFNKQPKSQPELLREEENHKLPRQSQVNKLVTTNTEPHSQLELLSSSAKITVLRRVRDKETEEKPFLFKLSPFPLKNFIYFCLIPPTYLIENEEDGYSAKDAKFHHWKQTNKKHYTEDSIRLYLQEIGRIRLLRADEEIELARKIADLLKLERVREKLLEQLDRDPSDSEWAEAVQLPLPAFRYRLHLGRRGEGQVGGI